MAWGTMLPEARRAPGIEVGDVLWGRVCGDDCGVREELEGLVYQEFGCDVEGSLGSWIYLVGRDPPGRLWPAACPIPEGLSHAWAVQEAVSGAQSCTGSPVRLLFKRWGTCSFVQKVATTNSEQTLVGAKWGTLACLSEDLSRARIHPLGCL